MGIAGASLTPRRISEAPAPTEAIVGRVKLGAGAPPAPKPAALESDTRPMLAGDALATDEAVVNHGESVYTLSLTHSLTCTYTHT